MRDCPFGLPWADHLPKTAKHRDAMAPLDRVRAWPLTTTHVQEETTLPTSFLNLHLCSGLVYPAAPCYDCVGGLVTACESQQSLLHHVPVTAYAHSLLRAGRPLEGFGEYEWLIASYCTLDVCVDNKVQSIPYVTLGMPSCRYPYPRICKGPSSELVHLLYLR